MKGANKNLELVQPQVILFQPNPTLLVQLLEFHVG